MRYRLPLRNLLILFVSLHGATANDEPDQNATSSDHLAARTARIVRYYSVNGKPVSRECGGALVGQTYLLTLGQCAQGSIEELKVYVEYENSKKQEEFAVQKIWTHPSFDMNAAIPDQFPDISLVRLTKDIYEYEGRRLSFLIAEDDTPPRTKINVAGWELSPDRMTTTGEFNTMTMYSDEYHDCHSNYPFHTPPYYFCMSLEKNDLQVCDRAQGSPVWHGNRTLVGLVARPRALRCSAASTLLVNIGHFSDWIYYSIGEAELGQPAANE